jgi:hypothetical protein
MHEFKEDFYGEEMGLLLLGYIREERKFSGLEELLATINADIATAKAELDMPSLAPAAKAPWLLAASDGEATMALLAPEELLPVTPPPAVAAAASDGAPPPSGFVWGAQDVY